jgi:hypothetical protein
MSDTCNVNLVNDDSGSINDSSRFIRMTIVSDAPSCGIILITLELSFMLLESSITRFIVQLSLMTIVIYNHHIFIILATTLMQCVHNVLAYFAMAVSYTSKMFMKSAPARRGGPKIQACSGS